MMINDMYLGIWPKDIRKWKKNLNIVAVICLPFELMIILNNESVGSFV